MVQVFCDQGRLFIRTQARSQAEFDVQLDRCQRITGSRWDKRLRVWHAPASPHVAREILCLWDGEEIKGDDGFGQLLEKLKTFEVAVRAKIEDFGPIPNERIEAWRHQRHAFHFVRGLEAALLYMGLGTGKTKVAIDLVCDDYRNKATTFSDVLIISPHSVVPVWPLEIEKYRHLDVQLFVLPLDKGTVAAKAKKTRDFLERRERPGIYAVVINYESARRKAFNDWSLTRAWRWVICDEIQKLKQPTGLTSKYCAKLRDRAARRLGLSGTPMPRDPLDIWAQYRFLDPGIYGATFGPFKAKYAVMGGFKQGGKPVQVVGFKNQEDLADRMNRICFKADRSVLDLPEATHINRYFEFNPTEAKAYKQMENEFVVWLGENVKKGDPDALSVSAGNVLVQLLRLQQITCGYIQDPGEGIFERLGHSKENLLLEVLEECGREPISVYCHFREDLIAVKRVAEKLGHRYGELSGERKDIHGKWFDTDPFDILGAQICAGGLGIDLTRARYQIYFSLNYDGGSYEQSLARIHRPGQTRPVTYIHLIVRGTTDEKVRKALKKKRKVTDAVKDMIL